jgi:iron-sulfur cluster repair protein YtfE (RIC family)
MTLSQVRAELLGEHFELRRLIEHARDILRKGDQLVRTDLKDSVDKLADTLLAHTKHEEAVLREVLPGVPGRAHPNAFMDEPHVTEHARLVSVLKTATDNGTVSVVQERVGALLDELEAHMVEEEEVLLGQDLLSEEETN